MGGDYRSGRSGPPPMRGRRDDYDDRRGGGGRGYGGGGGGYVACSLAYVRSVDTCYQCFGTVGCAPFCRIEMYTGVLLPTTVNVTCMYRFSYSFRKCLTHLVVFSISYHPRVTINLPPGSEMLSHILDLASEPTVTNRSSTKLCLNSNRLLLTFISYLHH